MLGDEALAPGGPLGAGQRPDLGLELLELLGKRTVDLLVAQRLDARVFERSVPSGHSSLGTSPKNSSTLGASMWQ